MKSQLLVVSLVLLLCLSFGCQNQQGALSNQHNYLTTKQPIVLFSINDGEAPLVLSHPTPEGNVKDSITVIRLSSDMPPVISAVYGTTSSTIIGTPRTAIVGRFGIVTNHDERFGLKVPPEVAGHNQIIVVDLKSDDLRVVSHVDLAWRPWLALTHPDSKRVIVALSDYWGVYKVGEDGALIEVAQSKSPGIVSSFDVSNDGKTIIGTMTEGTDLLSLKEGIFHFVMNEDSSISLVGEITSDRFKIDLPFSPRISPDGKRALVLNSGGGSDGELDDVLVLSVRRGQNLAEYQAGCRRT